MANVIEADVSGLLADAYATKALTLTPPFYASYRWAVTSATLTNLTATSGGAGDKATAFPLNFSGSGGDGIGGVDFGSTGSWKWLGDWDPLFGSGEAAGSLTPDVWHTVAVAYNGTNITWTINGAALFTYALSSMHADSPIQVGATWAPHVTGAQVYYIADLKIGTTLGGTDIFNPDLSGGTFTDFDSTTNPSNLSIVADPGFAAAPVAGPVEGRVLIALDDGPLVASPTWTRIDDTDNLVSGFDFESGRQTLTSRTDTGTATVYINDTAGLFDPNNTGSLYYGKVVGRQIMLQVYDPTTATWEKQWRGVIDEAGFDIHPATNPDGTLVLATVQLDCVDVFDYLAGYGLTPGLDGVVPPPTNSEGTIWYAETSGTVDDRIIEVLADTGIDSDMQVVFSGNVKLQATNYDADESALTVLRDCADAELPFIGNIYVDRQGRFCFHGRRSRFQPDGPGGVATGASPGAWPFMRWKVGDGLAIADDSDRAQIRVLAFTDGRPNIINAVLCYPKAAPGIFAETDIPDQVYADATSITAYGKHAASPITDLVIKEGTTTGNSAKVECQKYAELLVKNQKDPRPTITSLVLKSVAPTDPRAAATWPVLTKADISDIVNVKVGYPGGVGIGDPDGEDYFIEGRRGTVRPLNPGYDYVELQLEVSPAEWSQDTHGVFA